jgi:hypothetical protein
MKCYGHYKYNSAKCKDCELLQWCKTAGDPKFFKLRNGEPSIIQVADPRTDMITIPVYDSEKTIKHQIEQISAQLLQESLSRIIQYCSNDMLSISILIARFSGMSYAAIAKTFNISKGTVWVKLEKIEEKNPELSYFLKDIKTSKHSKTYIKNLLTQEQL